VARRKIPNISKSFEQEDNKVHSIFQGYMTNIEENNSVHQLPLKIMTDSNVHLPPPTKNRT
jgi:hypothetical protein